MLAARNNLSMCLHPDERLLFAGSLSGQILTIDVDDFVIRHRTQAHAGGIHAIACHPTLPFVAAMSTERAFSIWRINDEDGQLTRVLFQDVRTLPCTNDPEPVPFIQSTSQALAFHPTKRRLLTRTGSGGLLEVEFTDQGDIHIVQSTRVHGREDLVQARYLDDGERILTMANFGDVALSEAGHVLRRWKFGHHNVHWAEHLEGSTYLLASDTRQVIRLDVSAENEPVIGPMITRDDLEHVTLNRRSGRAFLAGFDGDVHEINTRTCASLGVRYKAPFKCRWVKTLERHPDTMILQCRNGGLHKINLASGRRVALIRETPEAIWSAEALPNGDIVMAGEARALYRLKIESIDALSRLPKMSVLRTPIAIDGDGHFKRLGVHPASGEIILGRSDGQVWIGEGGQFRPLCNLAMPVRDLCLHPKQPIAFVCTEGGRVFKIDISRGEVVREFESPIGQPIWVIDYNPQADLLAFAEREGSLYMVRGEDFRPVTQILDIRRPKRLKWRDAETLLWSRSVEIYRHDLSTGQTRLFVRETGNSIEDFIWDPERRYLVVMNYNCLLILCDYETGDFIDVTPDRMDYSKGLVWVPRVSPESYPLDFLSLGRSGVANLFRIHDEKILSLGPAAMDGWFPKPGEPRNSA
ncbi:hypothetical protein OU995_01805 [Roseateles sp. SL47]|uniref:hypothetical protein n=1 Tax=Roseateles sp. SL47 TaxID=2995138 RepID=UPI00226F2C0F|nr:hypothetical protein [Roseateles sp. SL47]WAC73509.1 hypothetical protein OU995_01805 [Roseateles sp. SL47]